MIIRRDHYSVLFLTQPDHAALAAEIVSNWRLDGFAAHPRRDDVLLAVREHDNGWLEEDRATLVGADGEPLDFMSAPVDVKQRIWPRAAARLEVVNPYAAALVAHHALTVYTQPRTDPVWRDFFERMDSLKSRLVARAGDAGPHLESDYRYLRLADQLSLVFCNGWTAPFPLAGGGRTILNAATLEIAPDPFEGGRVPLRIQARRLPHDRSYASPAALRDALDRAPVEWLEGEARGSS